MIAKFRLCRDSHNSYPDGQYLEMTEMDEVVKIEITGSDREVTINKRDLFKYVHSLDIPQQKL